MSFNNNNSFSAKDYLWVYKEDYDNSKLEKFNKSLAYFKEKENKTK